MFLCVLSRPCPFPVSYALRLHRARDATIMVPRGLEPRTLQLLAVRSNQLSYETVGDTGLVSPYLRQKVASHLPRLLDEGFEIE